MFNPAFWWTVAGIVLMICEFSVPGLILFFFGVGALVTALAALLFPMSLTMQLIVFVVASLVSLFGLRRFLKPVFMGRSTAVNDDDSVVEGMVGEECEVSESIVPGASGKVVLHGTAWKAESKEALEVGQAVVVVNQKSLTLIVKSK